MKLDPETGLPVDEEGTGGSVDEQVSAPSFAPPPVPESNPLTQPVVGQNVQEPAASFEAPPPPRGSVETRRPVLSPADTANLQAISATNAALADNAAAQHDTAEQAGDAKVDRAVDAAANAQAEADEKSRQAAVLEAERQKHEQRVQQLQAKHAEAYEKYKAMGLKDPDADESFGHKLAAALAIGLGQYSAAINHTSNAAATIFENARKENYARQNAAIEKAKDEAIAAGGDVREAMAEMHQSQADLRARQIAQIDAFRSKFAAESARLGIPEARIAATATMQALDKQGLEEREKYLDAFQRHLEATRAFERGLTPKEAGKGKGGGGGGADATSLVKMAEDGAKRSAIVAEAKRLGLPEKVWKNQVDLAFVERAKGDESAREREVKDFAGNPIGTAIGTKGANEARTRTGNAQALVDQLDKAIESIERDGTVVGAFGVGSEAYKERARLLAGVQSKARVFSELPSSEGGLKLEHAQVGEVNTASAKQLKALRDEVIAQTNSKNRALVSGAPAAAPPGASEAAKSGGGTAKPKASDAERAKALMASPAYQGFSPAKRAFLLRTARGDQ